MVTRCTECGNRIGGQLTGIRNTCDCGSTWCSYCRPFYQRHVSALYSKDRDLVKRAVPQDSVGRCTGCKSYLHPEVENVWKCDCGLMWCGTKCYVYYTRHLDWCASANNTPLPAPEDAPVPVRWKGIVDIQVLKWSLQQERVRELLDLLKEGIPIPYERITRAQAMARAPELEAIALLMAYGINREHMVEGVGKVRINRDVGVHPFLELIPEQGGKE